MFIKEINRNYYYIILNDMKDKIWEIDNWANQ